MAKNPQNTKKRDQKKLATYLGARSAHRFRKKGRLTTSQAQWRLRLYVLAGAIGLVCFWSVWRELF